jgi:cyclase
MNLLPRIIPVLLLSGKGLVKGVQFKDHKYIGDPINAVQIFNAKLVDEIIFLDINATKENRIPPLDLVQRIADQCLMPFAVGGGIKTVEQAKDILSAGAEKVCINTSSWEKPKLISQIADKFGTQSVVVSLDFKKNLFGKILPTSHCGKKNQSGDLVETALRFQKLGAGEILLNNVDLDGTMQGYNLEMIKKVTEQVSIPVIASGGAGNYEHLSSLFNETQASAAAAGSLFVFHGPRKAVLISYPDKVELKKIRRVG